MANSPLDDFLSKNTIAAIDRSLPLVHSTKSLNLRELVKTSRLRPSQCDVFSEELLYFFLGRPAYRWTEPEGEPQYWELPTCFVFDKINTLPIKRVYPFDSGAYHRGVFPSYVQNIPRENFESHNSNAPERMVAAFYGNLKDYIRGKPKSETKLKQEFDITVTDAEVLAIRKLAEDGTPAEFDDRRFSIEIQTEASIDFEEIPPSAIILPTVYLDDAEVRGCIENWGAEIISYDLYGLSLQLYYGAIFYKFVEYCRSKGFAI